MKWIQYKSAYGFPVCIAGVQPLGSYGGERRLDWQSKGVADRELTLPARLVRGSSGERGA
jgi:hypothetical protein